MERTEYMKKMYQESVKEKQMKLRTRSSVHKTEQSDISRTPASKTNGFLSKMFTRRKNPTENEEQTYYNKFQAEQFRFSFFDKFDNQQVNITGQDQTLDKFRRLIAQYKIHQLQQIRLIDTPRSGQKISTRFKQKVQVVLSHFFPYQIVFCSKDYQITLTNKIQRYSKKYKSFINLSNARTFLEDKNKKPQYVLLVSNLFQDFNEVRHQFDELILGLVDGVFNNQMVTAQKIKCMTFAEERVGVVSINKWRNSNSFISIISGCIHQILHILQFDHCFKKKCLMNLRPNNAGLTMCSDCLQKFHSLFNVDFKKWFGQLSEVLRIIEEPEEAQKLRQVYEALQSVEIDI